MNEPVVVLDACALIAFFNDEPGAEIVASILEDTPTVIVAAVNVLEVAYDAVKVTGDKTAAMQIIDSIEKLPCSVQWDLNPTRIAAAAAFKVRHRISMADAVALALATDCAAPLATSDHHEFDPVDSAREARFIWIR